MSILFKFSHILASIKLSAGRNKLFLRNSIGSTLLRIGNLVLATILSVVLARVLGPDNYGKYSYLLAIITLLSIPAQLGIPTLVVRETAKKQALEEYGKIRGLWIWAVSTVVASSVILFGIGELILEQGYLHKKDLFQQDALVWGLLLLPLLGVGNVVDAALRGLRFVILGQFSQVLFRPACYLCSLLLVVWIFPKDLIPGVPDIFKLYVLAVTLGLLLSHVFLYLNLPREIRERPAPEFEVRKWFLAILPLALTAGMQQINQNADIFMLGFFVVPEDIGMYKVAVQVSNLVVFGHYAITIVVSPYFARYHAQEALDKLQRLVRLSVRVAFLTALISTTVFLLLGDKIVFYLFGENYLGSYIPLSILCIGQVACAAFGPVNVLLNMANLERDTALGMTLAASANVIFNLFFIPAFGISGAAFATAVTLFIWNIFLWQKVKNKLGIQSFVLFN